MVELKRGGFFRRRTGTAGMTFQGHVENGLVVVDQPLPFPNGTPVRVELVPGAVAGFWQSLGLDELAARQGVAAIKSTSQLLGGWPADDLDDGFEDSVRQWRERELEQG
jgi:hypothetical protein